MGRPSACALRLLLASLKLVGEKTGKRIVLLIDDLHSELDEEPGRPFIITSERLDLQLFISNIEDGFAGGFEGERI